MKIIRYFQELLATLKRIEQHLEKMSSCVGRTRHGYSSAFRINDDNNG